MMRVTNSIIINNNLYNINKNKRELDRVMTQIDTTKKISRPSDDPITAIRALRLRSTYDEIQQYKDRNVKDAQSWMSITKDSMDKVNEVLENILYYCNQGVNTYQTVEEYDAIITDLKQYRDEIYTTGNADYGDRTIFTGYKTDITLAFTKDEPDLSYDITEIIKFSDIDNVGRVVGVPNDDIYNYATAPDYRGTDITNETLHIAKLAYDKLDATNIPQIPNAQTTVRSLEALGQEAYANIPADGVVFIPETGELIFGDNVYGSLVNDEVTVSYSKTGFEKDELRPEHYFDCTKTEVVGGQTKVSVYTAQDQKIDYIVSFNQSITVNVQGKDIFKHAMARDIDEMIKCAEDVTSAMNKLAAIESNLAKEQDETLQEKLTAMKEAVELELAYAQENLKNSFADGIERFKGHQQTVSVALSDLAARMSRLEMIEDRLEQQSLTVEELKSQNEDTNMADATVEWNALTDVYDAALAIAARVVQRSLLDFI